LCADSTTATSGLESSRQSRRTRLWRDGQITRRPKRGVRRDAIGHAGHHVIRRLVVDHVAVAARFDVALEEVERRNGRIETLDQCQVRRRTGGRIR
jgi:hypothetical protein